MSETLSIKMEDSPETVQAEIEERNNRYSQRQIDRLERELSPLDALATFMRPGVIIPPYPAASHTTKSGHLHGCDQKIKHVSDTDEYKKLELTGENTFVDLIKAPLSDLDSQIRVVKSRAHFEQKVARAFDEHKFQYGYRVKAPTNTQFFADWKRFCQDHQVPPAPGTTVDKVHSLPQIVRRALINQYHPRGSSPMDPEITKELLRRKDNLECTPLLVLFDTQPYIREFQLKGLQITREMMEDAGMNVERIAASMGEALAILHFKCKALGLVCFALGASPAYEAWKFGPLEIGIHIPSFHQLLETQEMSVKKIYYSLGDHTGVIPSSPEYLNQDGDEVWQSFRTAYIKQGNACRTKDSLPTPEAVMKHFESLCFEMEE